MHVEKETMQKIILLAVEIILLCRFSLSQTAAFILLWSRNITKREV